MTTLPALPFAVEFFFQVTNILDALADLFDVLVETTNAPAAVGRGELELVNGPFCGLQGFCNFLDVWNCVEPVRETANEEETVWLGGAWRAEFEGYQARSIVV